MISYWKRGIKNRAKDIIKQSYRYFDQPISPQVDKGELKECGKCNEEESDEEDSFPF
ncbi:MAG: hypothetical protein VSS75_034700 [Candidatus Parabeggiatoa sp.]|nr:hypothetical protein [Candidatus Parabeggiatoa sp.]